MNTELRDLLARSFREMYFGSEEDFPLLPTVDRYFTPDFSEVVDGRDLDHDGFLANVRQIRAHVQGGDTQILDAVREGDRFACRHVLHIVGADGSAADQEVCLFGEFAEDGRCRRITAMSRNMSGPPAHTEA